MSEEYTEELRKVDAYTSVTVRVPVTPAPKPEPEPAKKEKAVKRGDEP